MSKISRGVRAAHACLLRFLRNAACVIIEDGYEPKLPTRCPERTLVRNFLMTPEQRLTEDNVHQRQSLQGN
jgi:hypothetical protein